MNHYQHTIHEPRDNNIPDPTKRADTTGTPNHMSQTKVEAQLPEKNLVPGNIRAIPPPVLDRNFSALSYPERICEAVRFQGLRLEYAVSPGGLVRYLMKRCVLLGLFLLIPAVLLLPILVVMAGQAVTLSAAVMAICENLFLALLFLLKAIGIVIGGTLLLGMFMAARGRR